MIVRTILHRAEGFYISGRLWIDVNFAFNNGIDKNRAWDFRFIGSPGWFAYDKNKEIYNKLNNEYKLSDWAIGENMEVDIEIEV